MGCPRNRVNSSVTTSASRAYRSSGLDVKIDVVPAMAQTMWVAVAALRAAWVIASRRSCAGAAAGGGG
jgi:hypothetical protein